MIRLTRANGQALYVNPEHLIEVGYDEDYKQTLVSTLAEGWYIQESPEEVARKVLEWRLMMFQYQTYLAKAQEIDDWTRTAAIRKALTNLAGLEETNHD